MVVYDMGSGLLRKAKVKMLDDEPDVRSALATGVDLVTFQEISYSAARRQELLQEEKPY